MLLIQVFINSWKKSLFKKALKTRADADIRPAVVVSGPGAKDLIVDFPQRMGGIVEKPERSKKWLL